MTDNYVLLYNTLGYEKNAAKRGIVRCIDMAEPETVGAESRWRLLDESGQQVRQGSFVYFGDSFGMRLWTLGFSDVTQEGGVYPACSDLRCGREHH